MFDPADPIDPPEPAHPNPVMPQLELLMEFANDREILARGLAAQIGAPFREDVDAKLGLVDIARSELSAACKRRGCTMLRMLRGARGVYEALAATENAIWGAWVHLAVQARRDEEAGVIR